ncbi:hypothetical protein HYU07_05680 [Candidatus Woesearchaeota archaeon]|nr:hypothetical protein [Candidatus Woesearchaeota archaeon]
MNKLRLGVAGYCPPTRFDEKKALDCIIDAYNLIIQDFPNHEITVVAGVTNVGVLKLAYEEAKRRGWKTAGVGCKKAYDFEWFPTDEQPIIVGENWGDESQAFVHGTKIPHHPHENGLDALVRIGGGAQSLREIDQMKAMGKSTYEYELEKF